ncbi:hypothetical protein B0H15DRAFT_832182 [Mycena belliarum]|uniref:F-box domain-containing protein n=1 Tax=Mycena belliarum TaxID=1033014 RepID=A0AAD6UC60_9AGAR|nr:hypothetical protein B0H15DRAFT_832182 [Mycena belliae]
MALSLQPPELLDDIASLLVRPSDLLSLALTSKTLYAIVVPQHLEFREIRCDARRSALWVALAQHPGLARRLRSLEMYREPDLLRSNLVPRCLMSGDNDVPPVDCSLDVRSKTCSSQCTERICAAISPMSALMRFCFHHSNFAYLHPIETIFEAVLEHCLQLRELEITFYDGLPTFESASRPLWNLSYLTHVSITVNRSPMIRTKQRQYLTEIMRMLSRCPDLEHLRLASEGRGPLVNLSPMLVAMSWPQLKRLVIEGDLTLNKDPAAVTFLARHTQLETLSLNEPLELPPLPHLRWLSTPEFRLRMCGLIPERFPLLEYAMMTDAYESPHREIEPVVRLLLAFPALCGATVALGTITALRHLSQDVPHLQRLALGCSPWNLDRARARETCLPNDECIAILASFPHLTHLDSSAVIGSNSDQETDAILDPFLAALAAAPQLRYVAVDMLLFDGVRPVHRWYALERDEEGKYAGRTEVRNLDRVRFHDWEDIFRQVGIS